MALTFTSCGEGGSDGSSVVASEQPERVSKSSSKAPRPTPPDREEQLRRAEAVRRAAEELHLRGISTDGYLMNLIVEEESYRVAFVKQKGLSLRSEIMVRVKREDFEILSVENE